MEQANKANTFRSLKLSPSMKKDFRIASSYSTSKMKIGHELNDIFKKNDMNTHKRVSIDHPNTQKINFNNNKISQNTQDISTKEEDSSISRISKLQNIQNNKTSLTSTGPQEPTNKSKNTEQIMSKSLSNQKDGSFMNFFGNNNSTKNIYKNNISINNYNRTYNICSSKGILCGSINKNYTPMFRPADPLPKRTIVPKVNPKFGKMKMHITLPDFKGDEPLTKFEYKKMLKENLSSPTIEKQYEVNLYINSIKMLNNLIYLKTPLNKEGLICLENLVNVKNLNKYYKGKDDEDMDIIYERSNINNNQKENESQENQKDMEILPNSKNNTGYIRPKTVSNELKPYYKLKDKNDNTLIFESRFESGNLLCAFRTEDENSYQLYLQNDTNTTGYIQWFFFRVSNTKRGRKVNFNIINMLRKTCIYNHGLKIMTYSTMAAAKENLGWHRSCFNTIYYANNLYVYNNNNNDKKRNLHSLSFDYEFKYDNDTVYFANSIPYFYSALMKELNHYELNEDKYPFFHRKTLATTLGGNDLDMLTINSKYDIYKNGATPVIMPKSSNYYAIKYNPEYKLNKSHILDERKAVVIISRQHPGETVGSYVIKGCIDFLMGESQEAKKLRDIYLFKIVPMMNPDGVLEGNSRTSFAGCDLNRRWGKPNEIIHPEVFYTKEMITKLATQRHIGFIIDCHGHFGTFNSLFYCNFKDDKKACKLFPFICCKLSKIINYQQCTFAMPKFKLSTERISLFNELDDDDNDNIVALETSFFGINRSGEYNKSYFTTNLLKEVGRDLCLGMLSYYYKYENTPIEVNYFSNKENLKKIDVDMREFETEIIKEVNEDHEETDLNEEKSESEPSVDNLDKNQIMRLMPGKRRRRRRKKNKNFDKKNNKKGDLDIELFNPLKEAAKKLEEEKKKKKNAAKIFINCNITKKINIIQKPMVTDPNMKHEYTQTEEIFFKMHWSYFAGQYKIMQFKKNRVIQKSNNFLGMSMNFFGNVKNKTLYGGSSLSSRKNIQNNNNSNLNNNINNNLNSNYNNNSNKLFSNFTKLNSNNSNLNNAFKMKKTKSLNNKKFFNIKNPSNINGSISNNTLKDFNKIKNEQNNEDNNNNQNQNQNFYKINNLKNSPPRIRSRKILSSYHKEEARNEQYSALLSNKPSLKESSYIKDNIKNLFKKGTGSTFIAKGKIINSKINLENENNINSQNENDVNNLNDKDNNIMDIKIKEKYNRDIIKKSMVKTSSAFFKQ